MKQTITPVVPPTGIPGRPSAPWRDFAILRVVVVGCGAIGPRELSLADALARADLVVE